MFLEILGLSEHSVDKDVLSCSVTEATELMQAVIKFCKAGTCINVFHFFLCAIVIKNTFARPHVFKNGNT